VREPATTVLFFLEKGPQTTRLCLSGALTLPL